LNVATSARAGSPPTGSSPLSDKTGSPSVSSNPSVSTGSPSTEVSPSSATVGFPTRATNIARSQESGGPGGNRGDYKKSICENKLCTLFACCKSYEEKSPLDSAGCLVSTAHTARDFLLWLWVNVKLSELFCIRKDVKAVIEQQAASNLMYDERILMLNSKSVELHNSTDSLYNKIRSKNLLYVPDWALIKFSDGDSSNGDLGRKPDPSEYFDDNGATVVHQCFVHERFDVVKWLVRSFPLFSLLPYLRFAVSNKNKTEDSVLPFGGQNLLHMAVLSRNYEFAKWLLDFYSKHSDEALFKLLTARVVTRGCSYFRLMGLHYYGETPLHFAVCMNDIEMVNMILSFISLLNTDFLKPINEVPTKLWTDPRINPALDDRTDLFTRLVEIPACRNLLFVPDCNGNNILHLCVLHNLTDMYDHLKYIALEMIRQELMREFHYQVKDVVYREPCDEYIEYCPRQIKYSDVYPNKNRLYKFTGHIRKVGSIEMPSFQVRKAFFKMQRFKLDTDAHKKVAKRNAGSQTADRVKVDLAVTHMDRQRLYKKETGSFPERKTFISGENTPSGLVTKGVTAASVGPILANGARVAVEESKYSASVGSGVDSAGTPQPASAALPGQRLSPGAYRALMRQGSSKESSLECIDTMLTVQRQTSFNSKSSTEDEQIKLLKELDEYHQVFDDYIAARDDDLKVKLRQWLYGTDIGIKDGAVYRMFDEFFLLGLNQDGHNPVTLAAARGKADILRHLIIDKVISRDGGYDVQLTALEFPIECYLQRSDEAPVSMYEPCVPPTTALRSGLAWICRDDDHNCLVNEIPEVKAIITAKWNRIGSFIANRNRMLYLVFLISMCLLTCLVHNDDREFQSHPVKQQPSTYLLIWCTLIAAVVFVADVWNWWRNGFPFLQHHIRSWREIVMNRMPIGAGLFDWTLRIIIMSIFISIIFVRFYMNVIRSSAGEVDFNNLYCTLIGACCLCTILYSFVFFTLFDDDFGSFLMTVTRIIFKDFVYFARFFVPLLIMFGLALKTITVNVDDNGFKHALRCMWELLNIPFNIHTNEYNPLVTQHQYESGWFQFLITMYSLLVNILTLNLLIGVMSNTYDAFIGKNALGKLTISVLQPIYIYVG
jgi:hypothetical protein